MLPPTTNVRDEREALIRASLAFLKRWEMAGGRGPLRAREALAAVFQFHPNGVLDYVIREWQRRQQKAS